MKIRELIEQLEEIELKHGDIPCLVETEIDYVSVDVEVDECAIENREGFGVSVKFLM